MGLCYACYSTPDFLAQYILESFLYQYIIFFLMAAGYGCIIIDMVFYLQIFKLLLIFNIAYHAILKYSLHKCISGNRYLEIALLG